MPNANLRSDVCNSVALWSYGSQEHNSLNILTVVLSYLSLITIRKVEINLKLSNSNKAKLYDI